MTNRLGAAQTVHGQPCKQEVWPASGPRLVAVCSCIAASRASDRLLQLHQGAQESPECLGECRAARFHFSCPTTHIMPSHQRGHPRHERR